MPQELSDFPEEVQVAFFIYGFLEDKWEGMSGTYLGKNWTTVPYFFDLYNVQHPKDIIFIMKLIEMVSVEHRMEEQKRKEKKHQRQQTSGSGKNYTHKVTR